MFIRFVSSEIDEDSHVEAGLFCAASELLHTDSLPPYELEALVELRDCSRSIWESPLHHLPRTGVMS